MPAAEMGKLLDRGVWKAPWMGPDGELVLLVVTSGHKLLIPPSILTFGSDYFGTFDALWELLDARDRPTLSEAQILRPRQLKAV